MDKHFRQHGALLYNSTVRSDIAVQNSKSARLTICIFTGPYDVLIIYVRFLNTVRPYTVNGCRSRINKAHFVKSFHNGAQAAGRMKVSKEMMPCRVELNYMRNRIAYCVDPSQVKFESGLMRYCRKMQHGVC